MEGADTRGLVGLVAVVGVVLPSRGLLPGSRGTAPRCSCPCAGVVAVNSARSRWHAAVGRRKMAAFRKCVVPAGWWLSWIRSLLSAGLRGGSCRLRQAVQNKEEFQVLRKRKETQRRTMKAWSGAARKQGDQGVTLLLQTRQDSSQAARDHFI